MILEAIIKFFFGLCKFLIPSYDGDFNVPDSVFASFANIVNSVAYFLPLNVLLPIFAFSIGLDAFNLVWKIVLRIKSFIPTMGD